MSSSHIPKDCEGSGIGHIMKKLKVYLSSNSVHLGPLFLVIFLMHPSDFFRGQCRMEEPTYTRSVKVWMSSNHVSLQ